MKSSVDQGAPGDCCDADSASRVTRAADEGRRVRQGSCSTPSGLRSCVDPHSQGLHPGLICPTPSGSFPESPGFGIGRKMPFSTSVEQVRRAQKGGPWPRRSGERGNMCGGFSSRRGGLNTRPGWRATPGMILPSSVPESSESYLTVRSRMRRSLKLMLPCPPECSCSAMYPSKDFGVGSVKSTIKTPLR